MKTPNTVPNESETARFLRLTREQQRQAGVRPMTMPRKLLIGAGAAIWAAVVTAAMIANTSAEHEKAPEIEAPPPIQPHDKVRVVAPAEPAVPVQSVEHIALSDAVTACEDAARERTTHPSTADFSILGANFKSYDDGTAIFATQFTARNSFNLELNFQLVCDFAGTEMTDIKIVEAS